MNDIKPEFTAAKDVPLIPKNVKFTEQCKVCKEMFIRLPSNGICPDCDSKKLKPKQEVKQPIKAEDCDACEDPHAEIGYGK